MKKLSILTLILVFGKLNSQQNITYSSFITNTDLQANNIYNGSSSPVGNTEGTLNVVNGSAVYTLPIKNFERDKNCNPAPEISIIYNSLAGDGILGRGWSIGGLSSIKLSNKKVATHNITEPSCTNNLIYELDGVLLRIDNAGSTSSFYLFKADNEDFLEVKGYKSIGKISYFTVLNKEGQLKYYGSATKRDFANASGQNTNCNLSSARSIEYYLDKITFPDGNERYYSYTNGNNHDITIESISDNFQILDFEYKLRGDYYETYKNGAKIKHNLLLTSITLNNAYGAKIRKYHFKYSTDNINSFLSQIQEEGSDGSTLNPLRIKYGDRIGNNYTTSSLNTLNTVITNTGKANVFSGDFDGNGITDYLVVDYDNTNQDLATAFKIFKLNATNNFSLAISQNLSGPAGLSFPSNGTNNFMTSDFNGDGRDDILIHSVNSARELQNSTIMYTNDQATGFNISNHGFPTRTSTPSGNFQKINANNNFNLIGDFDGDGSSDFIVMTSNGASDRLFINFPKKNIYNVDLIELGISGVSSTWCHNKLHVIDFDGDGKNEIVEFDTYVPPNTFKTLKFKVFEIKQNGTSWEANPIYSSTTPNPSHNYFVGDFNGDGKSDFFSKKGNNTSDPQSIFFSTGNTFEEKNFPMQMNIDLGKLNNCEAFIKMLDVNGDGKTDVLYNQDNETDVYFSKGYDFYRVRYTGLNFGNKKCKITGGDFNGDGKGDFITLDNITSSQVKFYNHYFFGHGNEKLVEKIGNSYNNTISISYKNLSNSQGMPLYTKIYQEANDTILEQIVFMFNTL